MRASVDGSFATSGPASPSAARALPVRRVGDQCQVDAREQQVQPAGGVLGRVDLPQGALDLGFEPRGLRRRRALGRGQLAPVRVQLAHQRKLRAGVARGVFHQVFGRRQLALELLDQLVGPRRARVVRILVAEGTRLGRDTIESLLGR